MDRYKITEMTYYVSSGTLNSTQSLTVRLSQVPIAINSDRSFCPIFLKFEM